jgi:hypothetical protein
MSTRFSCCSPKGKGIACAAGLLVVAGVAALFWYLAARADQEDVDPQAETDRRIDELEGSLRRLRETFSHTTLR